MGGGLLLVTVLVDDLLGGLLESLHIGFDIGGVSRRIARERIDPRYGELTIGALLDRYEQGGGGSARR